MLLTDGLPDIAVTGERGIDVFVREEDPSHNRSRFRCLGSVIRSADGRQRVESFMPAAQADPARLLRAASGLVAGNPALQGLTLADSRSYPALGVDSQPFTFFLYVDFLRAWSLAGLGITRQARRLDEPPDAALGDVGPLVSAVEQIFEFNRIAAGRDFAVSLLAVLRRHGRVPEHLGWPLRMLGDLALRGGHDRLALDCFEASLAAGDNEHRRSRALAAAEALGESEAIARHRGALKKDAQA